MTIFKQQRYDDLYMDIANRVAQMSYAVRAKVGCILVRNGNILGMGFNGMPAGMDNTCELELDGALVTKPEVSHAEENLLGKLVRSTQTSEASTAYVTLEPCIHCAKLLFNAGIVRLVYDEEYRLHDGVNYLIERGVKVEKHEKKV